MMTMSNNAREREEIEALLPWHAAGTLSRRDAERVELALATDQELARHYDLVREELAETIHLNETLGAPSARAMEALLGKIDAEPSARRVVAPQGGGFVSRIGEFLDSLRPRTLAWSATAAAFALLLQAGIIAGVLVGESDGRFQTASSDTGPIYRDVELPQQSVQAFIRFVPTATADEITKFLESNQATLVSGPASGGLYRVRVAVKGDPKEQLPQIIRNLQDNKTVAFAAPAN